MQMIKGICLHSQGTYIQECIMFVFTDETFMSYFSYRNLEVSYEHYCTEQQSMSRIKIHIVFIKFMKKDFFEWNKKRKMRGVNKICIVFPILKYI